ncbi:hypothetical protein V9T40_013900 [Parthenolecanium corni]|uniref:Uncharacterized protein n=1 Tax=Parthenolecanium corni TaxID=536013 RepID=A0AAN9TPW3_9HEMI
MERIKEMRWQIGSILPPEMKTNLSPSEEQWLANYSKSLASYMKTIGPDGGLNLLQDLKPPKSLYIVVRSLVDVGRIELDDGDVVILKKDAQYMMLRSQCESLIHQGKKEKLEKFTNPREKANIFSVISFFWTFNLFVRGYKRDLEVNDLYDTLQAHSASRLGHLLESEWDSEIEKATKCHREPKLHRALFNIFGASFIFYGVVVALSDIIFCYGLPMCLKRLVMSFSTNGDESNSNRNQAFLYASGIIMCLLFYSLIWHWYIERVTQTGIQMRVAVSCLLYKKALQLGSNSLGRATNVGHLINVLSNDSSRFDKSLMFLNHLWVSPFGTAVITYFLWLEIGFCAFIGVAVLLLFIPLHGCLGKKISQFRLASSICTDRRVRVMNEIISGILVIKMYAWEKLFTQLITKSRREEMQKISSVTFIRQIMASFQVFHWRIAFFCSILTYILIDNMISAQKVFIAVAYFKVLRESMTSYFPLGIFQTAELLVSLKRLQSFLMLQYNAIEHSDLTEQSQVKYQKGNQYKIANSQGNEELTPLNEKSDEIFGFSSEEYSEYAIRAENFTAKWDESILEYCLSDISIEIKKNTLAAFIGPVGAGKSALMLAILKELTAVKGSFDVSGTVSYASQKPWMFSGSIKQNILFGQPWNGERYQKVIEVCALLADFNQLPYADNTIVGERGTLLSVGQRARVNLARCIYREADIYLFDDPLSSVDVHVGKHIFEKCFRNFLKNKTCILVTHEVQYLSYVDRIVFLERGSVIASGSYKELLESGFNFNNIFESEENEKIRNKSFENDLFGPHCQPVLESVQNSQSPRPNDIVENPKQMEEQIAKGTVQLDVYRAYTSKGGKLYFILIVAFLFVLTQIFASSIDIWIAYWVNLENLSRRCRLSSTSENEACSSFKNPIFYLSLEWGIHIFSILTGSTVIIALLRTYTFVKLCCNASLNLHVAMFKGIVYAPIHFFNTNPSGRILNRFSKDLAAVDEYLPGFLMNFLQSFLPLISIVCIVAVVNPYILLPTFFIIIMFFALYYFYLATSRNIRRIECVASSSVYSHFHSSLQGLVSIRAYGAENILLKEFHHYMDVHSSASYLFIATGRAFGLWCDMIGLLFIAVVAFGLNSQLGSISEGNVGLAITQTLFLTGSLQWCLRQKSELENQMTAVERIKEYSDLPQEDHLLSGIDKPPTNWPAEGEIIFDNVSLRYEPTEWYILKNLNFTIGAGEKIGIVGRTGAGKSSLIAALFRLTEIDGKIKIDGIDVSTLPLYDFRKRISVIPQEPVLFSGTVRTNLDPFDEYSDGDLWHALQEVQLVDVFRNSTQGLNSEVSDGGSNFSVGQKQLLCLARAIIRNNKILILDEATANVDSQTDALIQTVIREKFRECTVLTIAHRLNSVMDSDRILVMDSGVCVEFDQPFRLLQNENGIFNKMVSNTSHKMSETLRNLAYQKHFRQMNDKLPFIDE